MPTAPIALHIELAAGKTPPTEFRLFTKGSVETTKGTFLFDDLAAQTVLANAADWGNEFPLDYDHQMVRWDAPADGGIAAGWFKPELRDGELWATSVSWTPKAAKHLTDREYRYCSPTFHRDDNNNRITQLINCALTNLPATKRMDPLVASQRPHGRDPEAAEPPSTEKPMKTLLIALGLTETTTEADAVVRAARLRELVQLTGKSSPDEAVGVVMAWKNGAERTEALAKRVAELETAATTREIELAIDAATTAGKVTPAQRESLTAFGRTNPAGLKAFLDAAPVVAAAQAQVPSKTPGKSASPDQVELAKQLGVKPEDLL